MRKNFSIVIIFILLVATNTYVFANNRTLIDIDTCTVTISPNDPIYNNPTTPFTLQLNGTQGADYYHWSPQTGLSDTIISNPIATINNSIQYVLEAYYVDEENLVYNGDFELGNLGFTTELNLSTDLWPAGNYNIVTLGSRYHYMFSSCTHNGGKFFVANGASTPNLIVYQTTVSVLPNTNYEFSFEATNVCPTATPEQLPQFQFSINSQQLGDVFSTPFSPCTWTKFHKFWNSGTNTTATITILNQNIVAGGNDFGIDNVALRVVCKASDTINISLTTANVDTCTVEIFQNDTTYYTSEPPFFVQLNASQGADYYNWIPATGLSDPHINNPIAEINNSIEYVLEAFFAGDSNLVYNGDFELGNTGFTTEYTLGTKPLQEGRYGVTDNGQSVHDGFMPCIHDGNFYVGNGSMYNSLVVFQSQVSVTPNTDYYFSSEVTAIDANPTHPISQLALFQFNINNTQIGNTLIVNDSPCVWTSYGEVWNSGNNTTATITIKDLNTGQWANDFALDNIALRKICKAYDTINITLKTTSTDTCTVEIFQNDTTYYTSEPPFFVQLNASQGADYYNWIPATGLSDPQIFNPIAQITNSIEYVLEACFAGDSNLVYNGDFELGNIGFFTDYLISSAPQIPRGSFKIVSNSNQANYGNTSCTNGGLFFAADASPSVGARVYQSTSPVEPNTDYIFSVDVTATYVETSADYPIMQYAINGEQLGNPITIGAGVCNWITTSKIWNSGNNTTATINIINQNTVGMGNDFAIDNIALRKICKAYDTINIILVDPSTIPKEISVKICEKDFPYTYYDSVFYGIGDYGYVFSTDGEIDSLYILNISTYPHYDITIYDTICEGQTYSNNGFEASSSGLYTNTFSTINGCDSLINLSLFVYPLTDTIINAYICEGEVYNQYGFNLANQGTYYNTYSFGEKCDRNIVLHLIVIDVPEMLLFPQDDIMVEEYPITLDATCLGCDSYMWNTGSFSPSIDVYSKGIYRVCAYSNCGTVCDSVSINNPDVYVFLPNSFTPNEASNNLFEIYTEKEKIELVSFEIFSRWGERVFETKDINMGWDGMFKGRLCNSDNFVFKVLFKTRYTGNLIYEKVGKVSLIR